MPKSRIPSPARSQGAPVTPRRNRLRSTRSVGSPARSTTSGRLSSIVDQFKEHNKDSFALSPLSKTVLSDNTDIEIPRRKSWWKKVENSRDVIEILDNDKPANPNVLEEFDVEILSQEKKEVKDYTLDLPESSDSESISSIVVPQRRLFTQKENVPQKKFGQVIGNRETMAKHNKTKLEDEKTANVGTKNLFSKQSKPVFPSGLLNITADKTLANKTNDLATEVKGQPRNLFGNRLGTKRKNMFADFVVSESEDEIPDIQPKLFAFHKQSEPSRRSSATSRGMRDPSPTSSITTDIEMDDWKLLPSSTMVEHQLEANLTTPGKRARLSKLSEAKESTATDSTKQSIKSGSSKNKSKTLTSPKEQTEKIVKHQTSPTNDVLEDSRPKTRNSTRNKSKLDSSKPTNTPLAQNNSNVVVGDMTETSNLKNRTRVIHKNANTHFSTQNLEETEQADVVDAKRHYEDEPACDAEMPEEQVEDDEEIALTYEDNEEHQEKSETHAPDEKKTKNMSSNNTLPKDSEVPDQLEKELASIVGEAAENIIQTETPIHEKSSHMNKKVVEETPDTQTFTEKLTQNAIPQKEATGVNASRKLENDEKMEASEMNDQHESTALTTEVQVKPQNKTVIQEIEVGQETKIFEVNKLKDKELDQQEGMEQEQVEANDEDAKEMEVSNQEAQQNVLEEVENDEEAEVSEQEVEVGDEVVEASDQEVEVSDQEVEVSDQEAEASDQEAEASDQEDEASDQEAEVSDQEAEVSDQEAEVSDQEAEVSDQEAEVSDQEAEVSDQEAEASDQEADTSEEKTEAEQELDADEEEDQEQSEQNIETSDNEEVQATENDIENDQEDHEVSQNIDDQDDDQEEHEDDEKDPSDNEPDVQNDSQEISHEEINESQEQMETADNETEEVEEENEEINDSEEPEQSEEHTNNQETEPQQSSHEDANITHDTTGRNRKKRETNSPEAILHNVSNEMDSFTAKGRNTSIRKTKSILKNFTIRPSLAPPRESTGFSDGTKNSSAEGSGWDSHRTTRKTLRQTFGKEFTPRKSLRALVMEKSAKRQTAINEANAELKLPQANSTELQDYNQDVEMDYDENVDPVESDHEISRRTRQTTLEMYLQKIKKENMDRKLKIEEQVRNSLKSNPVRLDVLNFKVPAKPTIRRAMKSSLQTAQKVKRLKPSVIPLEDLPQELVEDMKYRPPKRFRPSNASWITKRLYKFLETKLEPKYDYKARVRAEKLVETIYNFVRDVRRHRVAPPHAVTELKREMARLDVTNTHFEFYNFFNDYLPVEIKVKVVPDIVNDIPLPREGVFAPILV